MSSSSVKTSTGPAPIKNNIKSNAKSANNSSIGNSSSSGSMMNKIKNMDSTTITIIIIVFISLLFIIVIVYIIFSLRGKNLTGKLLTTLPIDLSKTPAESVGLESKIPPLSSGIEYAYSFWIYIDSYNQSFTSPPLSIVTGNTNKLNNVAVDKLVFYRGSSDNIATANPVVTMDGLSNKMYIAIKTTNSILDSSCNNNLANIRFNNYFNAVKNTQYPQKTPGVPTPSVPSYSNPNQNQYVILTIDYIPLQRWVNISYIVNNKLLTVLVDGEIYSVTTTDEIMMGLPQAFDQYGNPMNINIILDKGSGSVYPGTTSKITNIAPINGYLSKLKFYNYAVSISDLRNFYNEGPIVSSSILGIPLPLSYGIRSPIYNLNEINTTN